MVSNPSRGLTVIPGGASRAPEAQAYSFGPFRLLPGERVLRRGDQTLAISPKAFDALLMLVRRPGHLILKGEFMNALWPDSFVEEVNLANNISALRKALGDDASDRRYIQTVPKQGYRFLPSVTSIWSGSSAPALSAQFQNGTGRRGHPIHSSSVSPGPQR